MTKNNTVYRWLGIATPAQAQQVAKIAKTSVPYLRHVAAGRRQVSADLAQRLSNASRSLNVRALIMDQQELCKACSVCPLV
jgi:hypothetical protein